MNRTLVFPEEFEIKLTEAYADNTIHSKWLEIGVNTVHDMIDRIISELNKNFPKLRVRGYRACSKDNIKNTIGNRGLNSLYTGYFETETGNVDGLFFYIPPKLDSGNDILTRQVMPSLLGIYDGISQDMIDLHFNNRPVYIVNLNETNRSEQRAVKISFICAELLGFRYLDLFKRQYRDVLSPLSFENSENQIINLTDFHILLSNSSGNNEYFEIDENGKTLILFSSRITDSSNASAEMYRYLLRVLPAIYMAIEKNYSVNITDFNGLTLSMINTFKNYISQI